MKKITVNCYEDTINFTELIKTRIKDYLIVNVFNGYVSILVESMENNSKVGFKELGATYNSVSQDYEELFLKNHNSEMYVFDNLKDFAEAVIKNNWKIY